MNNDLKRACLALSLALAVFAAAGGRAWAGPNGPRQVVDEFHGVLLGVMRDATLGYSGRYARLTAAVDRTFHLPVMTQVSAGDFWRDAPQLQRQALIAAFTNYGISLLARNFSGDGIKQFDTVAERPGPQNTTLVDARLVRKNGSDIDITYALKPHAGSWRVVDVVLDRGISELALRRSEFSHGLANGGLPVLATTLNGKAEEFAQAANIVEIK